jgi:capsular exopolysaccharide synthesis family protein
MPESDRNLTGAQLEAFRHLRTNVLALTDASEPRTIMLISAGDGEGKSTILSYFAISLARTGRSVLILDADLRKPSQHTFFEASNEIGLVELLRGETTVKSAVQRTKIPGLSLLPSGKVNEDAAELLSGDTIGKLLEGLKAHFDVILIDTAPVLPVADTAIIAPHTDTIIQVVRSGYSRAVMTTATIDQITDIHLRPIGIVLNDVSQTESSYYTVIPT